MEHRGTVGIRSNHLFKIDAQNLWLINGHISTISSHLCPYINIFHKIEVQTVILRCWTGLKLNWFKSYDTKRKYFRYLFLQFCKKTSLLLYCFFAFFAFVSYFSYLWGILGQWDILLLNLTFIGFTIFFRCLIFDHSFFTNALIYNQRWDI